MALDGYADAIITFVRDHKAWAGPIVLLLAFGESIAFISLVLPFWAILVALGTLLGASGGADFWYIVVMAAVGAALGDWFSYWLGYHYHEQIARMWPLRNYPQLIPKGHEFFEKYGAWAIVIARFSGPLRASVPLVAGIVQMPRTIFQIANWSSAFLWAFVLLKFGDVAGQGLNALRKWLGGG